MSPNRSKYQSEHELLARMATCDDFSSYDINDIFNVGGESDSVESSWALFDPVVTDDVSLPKEANSSSEWSINDSFPPGFDVMDMPTIDWSKPAVHPTQTSLKKRITDVMKCQWCGELFSTLIIQRACSWECLLAMCQQDPALFDMAFTVIQRQNWNIDRACTDDGFIYLKCAPPAPTHFRDVGPDYNYHQDLYDNLYPQDDWRRRSFERRVESNRVHLLKEYTDRLFKKAATTATTTAPSGGPGPKLPPAPASLSDD